MDREELTQSIFDECTIQQKLSKENGICSQGECTACTEYTTRLEDKVIEHKQLLYDKGVLHAKYQSRIKELEEGHEEIVMKANKQYGDYLKAITSERFLKDKIKELEESIELRNSDTIR